jgi:hypothetical protein
MYILKSAFEKRSFLGGIARTFAPQIAGSLIHHKVLPKLVNKPGLVGNLATGASNLLNNDGLKGSLAHMALHSAIHPVTDKAIDSVEQRFK